MRVNFVFGLGGPNSFALGGGRVGATCFFGRNFCPKYLFWGTGQTFWGSNRPSTRPALRARGGGGVNFFAHTWEGQKALCQFCLWISVYLFLLLGVVRSRPRARDNVRCTVECSAKKCFEVRTGALFSKCLFTNENTILLGEFVVFCL